MPKEIKSVQKKGTQPPTDVFISYAHEDKSAALKLVEELKQRGLRIWFDKDEIRAGENWMDRIREGIDNSRFAVVILSHASTQHNKFISKEWAAIQESCWRRPDLPVVVLQLDDVQTPAFLQEWKSLSCRRDSDWNAAAEQIRRQMTTGLPRKSSRVRGAAKQDASKRFREIREALTRVASPKRTATENER